MQNGITSHHKTNEENNPTTNLIFAVIPFIRQQPRFLTSTTRHSCTPTLLVPEAPQICGLKSPATLMLKCFLVFHWQFWQVENSLLTSLRKILSGKSLFPAGIFINQGTSATFNYYYYRSNIISGYIPHSKGTKRAPCSWSALSSFSSRRLPTHIIFFSSFSEQHIWM